MLLRQIPVAPLSSVLLILLIAFVASNSAHRQPRAARVKPQQAQQQQQQHGCVGATTSTGCSLESPATAKATAAAAAAAAAKPSGAVGYLLAEPTNQQLNQSNAVDATLASVLARNGPDMRPLRGFTDFDDITLEVAKRAWRLMHHHAHKAIRERIEFVAPLVEQSLRAANVSGQCVEGALKTMDSAKWLDSWAIQLLSSWGNFPPTGIYEGTFGDIGSFHGCINVPANDAIGHAHYCTISYRPVMPGRPNYELLVRKEPDELLKLFRPDDAFAEVLANAQYNHYVYYKFGTCFPIKCSPKDVQRLAKMLGARSILMSGPVKCHSKYEDDYQEPVASDFGDDDGDSDEQHQREANGTATLAASSSSSSSNPLKISTRDLNGGVYIWRPHITGAQQVALGLFTLVTAFVLLASLLDVLLNRLPNLLKRLEANGGEREHYKKAATGLVGNSRGQFVLVSATAATAATAAAEESSHAGQPNGAASNGSAFKRVASRIGLYAGDDCVRVDDELDAVTRLKAAYTDEKKGEREGTADNNNNNNDDNTVLEHSGAKGEGPKKNLKKVSLLRELISDYSIVSSLETFFHVSRGKNDISCINGIRCITMSWIVITHTMQYNDWSAFARTREIETHLKSLINQPLFNASYLVDTFFLVSGLLTAFSSFNKQRKPKRDEYEIDGNNLLGSNNNNNNNNNNENDNNKNNNSQREQVNRKANGTRFVAGASAPAQNLENSPLKKAPPLSSFSSFSWRSYLIGRYLRLTPQIMFVAILFILLPLLSKNGGPHWYTMTGEYSENCSQNWWINLLHLQAFYRSNEMCNFVSWWISVDMFYHLFALALILTILTYGHLAGLISCLALVLINGTFQAGKHYRMSLPPNLLSTIPQTGAMWSQMTLEFFWTPYAHVFPFFLGFYLGYLMAKHQANLRRAFSPLKALIGWAIVIACLIGVSYSTYFWVIGKCNYSRLTSTLFYLTSSVVWSSCLAWIIVACHLGYGGFINKLLSCNLFIILGKASYIVYLSHFLVLFTFFGGQNLLLEPTQLVMSYVILGNICLSMLFGSFLCVVYETPWLKTQRRLMKYVA